MRYLGFTALVAGATLVGGMAASQSAEYGKEYFVQYCATCHGSDAEGAGPLAELITTNIPDLTDLTQRNDGEFPMLKVIHIIDGRTGLRAHGGPMPVYGAVFNDELGIDSPHANALYSRGKVLSIAYYLDSIQK